MKKFCGQAAVWSPFLAISVEIMCGKAVFKVCWNVCNLSYCFWTRTISKLEAQVKQVEHENMLSLRHHSRTPARPSRARWVTVLGPREAEEGAHVFRPGKPLCPGRGHSGFVTTDLELSCGVVQGWQLRACPWEWWDQLCHSRQVASCVWSLSVTCDSKDTPWPSCPSSSLLCECKDRQSVGTSL